MNYEFLSLQVIGIILIVIGHKGGISLFSEWFPFYSFHLPLFIFISGYFFKNNKFKTFVIKKIKKLLIPYFLWSVFYIILSNILQHYDVIYYSAKINFHSLFIEPWITGSQGGLNLASWFVPALFLVQIIYFIINLLFKKIKINNEYIKTIILLLISLLGIKFAIEGKNFSYYIPLTRTMMYLFFFQFGVLYKKNLESNDKLNSYIYFIALFIIQFIILYYTNGISYVNVSMNFVNNSIFLPIITSLTGILLWLRIAKLITPLLKQSQIAIYIGNNTWTIMMHHQFYFFLFNLFFLFLSNSLVGNVEFKSNAWYAYIPSGKYQFSLFAVIFGIFMPIVVKYLYERLKVSVNEKNIKK